MIEMSFRDGVVLVVAGWLVNWLLYSYVADGKPRPNHEPLVIVGLVPYSFAIIFPIVWVVATFLGHGRRRP